ncbi:MAG: hypothetical protein M5U12_28005 [Verrucomicrobia bacterium]|nr:hypothetical protein [Verrucomicrobiota bacterium]
MATNLFRYVETGTYYLVRKVKGWTIWRSLGTADRDEARRKIGERLATPGVATPPAPPVAPATDGAPPSLADPAKPPSVSIVLNDLLKLYEANLSGSAARRTR